METTGVAAGIQTHSFRRRCSMQDKPNGISWSAHPAQAMESRWSDKCCEGVVSGAQRNRTTAKQSPRNTIPLVSTKGAVVPLSALGQIVVG
jgi:hypothetical protein